MPEVGILLLGKKVKVAIDRKDGVWTIAPLFDSPVGTTTVSDENLKTQEKVLKHYKKNVADVLMKNDPERYGFNLDKVK